VKKEIFINLVLSAAAGALIWALSPELAGKKEPWDSDSPYYFASLLVAGAVLGMIGPRYIWAHAAGIVLGQLVYMLVFLPVGPLIVLGVFFLAGYSLLCVGGAAIGSRARQTLERAVSKRRTGGNQ